MMPFPIVYECKMYCNVSSFFSFNVSHSMLKEYIRDVVKFIRVILWFLETVLSSIELS